MTMRISGGIYNRNANSTLKLISPAGIELQDRTDVTSALQANYFHLNRNEVLNNDQFDGTEFGTSGVSVKRCLAYIEAASTVFVYSTNTVTVSTDISTWTANDIFHVSGSDYNDGFFEINSIGGSNIIVKTVPTYGFCNKGLIATETIVARMVVVNPAFIHWDNINSGWWIGYINAAKAEKKYLVAGVSASNLAVDFSSVAPNLLTQGSNITHSGAANTGVYAGSFTTLTGITVQAALDELDVVAGGLGGSVAPAFTLGESNVIGTANFVGADATIALFQNVAPVTITPDATGSKGTVALAARNDHVHGIVTATPVEVSRTNAEGVSTSFSRADHQHQVGIIDGPIFKTGTISIGDGESDCLITFTTPFSSHLYILIPSMEASNLDPMIACDVTYLHLDHATVRFSAATTGINYKLHYLAIGD